MRKAIIVVKKLQGMELKRAAEIVKGGIKETLSYYNFLREHWRRIRINNPLERIMKEIRRRTTGGWGISGWQFSADAGSGKVTTYSRNEVGNEAVL